MDKRFYGTQPVPAPVECAHSFDHRSGCCTKCDRPLKGVEEYRPQLCPCSKPERPVVATHGEWCVYCWHRDGQEQIKPLMARYLNSDASQQAARRMAAQDRRERQPVTATMRELAKSHPWELDE